MANDDDHKDDKPAGNAKKKPVVLFVIIGVVLLGVAGGGVFVAGPALGLFGDEKPATGKAAKKKKKQPKASEGADGEEDELANLPEESSDTAGLKSKIAKISSLVVDVQDAEGARHHVKINLAVEHPEGKEEEFANFEPRAREALIMYLRTLTFEEATDPKGFPKIRDAVIQKTRKALGEFPARRILIADFVAQ